MHLNLSRTLHLSQSDQSLLVNFSRFSIGIQVSFANWKKREREFSAT